MTDKTAVPDWWSEDGERAEARKQSAELHSFLAHARLLPPRYRSAIELAMFALEGHANAQ